MDSCCLWRHSPVSSPERTVMWLAPSVSATSKALPTASTKACRWSARARETSSASKFTRCSPSSSISSPISPRSQASVCQNSKPL